MHFSLNANETGQKVGRDIVHLPVISERQEGFMPCKNRSSAEPFQDEDGNFGFICTEIRLPDLKALML